MNQKNIISKLTLEEKIAMIHAAGLFRSGAVKRLNIPSLVMSDGPSGVRQEFENDSWTPIDDTTDFVSWLPSNTCLCTTWNPNLAHKFGEVLGNEARGRGKDVILAPGININRDKASIMGVSTKNIAQTLQYGLSRHCMTEPA